jgi:YafQ family addiction module toxin component
MSYSLELSKQIDMKFKKLSKKQPKKMEIIEKKTRQIIEDPYRFKPLRGRMHGIRRVHIDKSFVLIYEIDEQRKSVRLLDFEHHDKVYV